MAEARLSSEDITCEENFTCRLLFCAAQFALILLLWICKDHTNLMPPSSPSSPSKVFGLSFFFRHTSHFICAHLQTRARMWHRLTLLLRVTLSFRIS